MKATKRTKTKPQDAVALLKADHAAVSELFKRYESGKDSRSEAGKAALAGKICKALTVHATIEEEIFYPAVRAQVKNAEDMLGEAEIEHGSAKDLIAAIEAGAPDDPLFDSRVKVLGEYIRHHVEEEHEEMFPKAQKSGLDMVALGKQLRARKTELTRGT